MAKIKSDPRPKANNTKKDVIGQSNKTEPKPADPALTSGRKNLSGKRK